MRLQSYHPVTTMSGYDGKMLIELMKNITMSKNKQVLQWHFIHKAISGVTSDIFACDYLLNDYSYAGKANVKCVC